MAAFLIQPLAGGLQYGGYDSCRQGSGKSRALKGGRTCITATGTWRKLLVWIHKTLYSKNKAGSIPALFFTIITLKETFSPSAIYPATVL